jgi:hypothetical protein
MRRTLGTLAATAIAMLAIAPLVHGEEQTRDSYKAQVEPLCQANRGANEKIMAGAKERVNKGKLELAGKQFIQVSGSVGGLVKQLATVPAPSADATRVEHWLGSIRLLRQRLREVGKYYKAGERIKAAHTSILAERAGLSANNTSIVFHFHYCRFGHIDGS